PVRLAGAMRRKGQAASPSLLASQLYGFPCFSAEPITTPSGFGSLTLSPEERASEARPKQAGPLPGVKHEAGARLLHPHVGMVRYGPKPNLMRRIDDRRNRHT